MVRFIVSPSLSKDRAESEITALTPFFIHTDMVISLGGDGTLLRAVSETAPETLVMPLNYGTRGYLTNRTLSANEIGFKFRTQGLRIQDFKTLKLLDRGTSVLAFNEFAIRGSGGQSAKIEVLIDGYPLSDGPITCDGVCVSTPQGSTGYAYSAGGPAISPEGVGMGITFICPYYPRFSPMVVPSSSIVTIRLVDSQYRSCNIHYDGKVMTPGSDEFVIADTGPVRKVAYLSDHDFTRRMISKIIR